MKTASIAYIGQARSPEEVRSSIALAAETFRNNDSIHLALEKKEMLMFPERSRCENNVVVIVDGNKEVIGTCFLIDKYFNRRDLRLKGTFLSSICIAESARGRKLSTQLMNAAVLECEKRASDFSIVIARRAVDHFYNKFGFWGVSSYSRLNFSLDETRAESKILSIETANPRDIEKLASIYSPVYLPIYGSCERTREDWSHILWKVKLYGASCILFKKANITVGYAIVTESRIYEIAAESGVSYYDLMLCLRGWFSIKEFTIHASPDHPLVNHLADFDISMNTRQCSYGGHMARIINYEKFESALRKSLNSQVFIRHKNTHNELLDKICMIRNRGNETSPLKLNDVSHEFTCNVLGVKYLSADRETSTAFDLQYFNIPHYDLV